MHRYYPQGLLSAFSRGQKKKSYFYSIRKFLRDRQIQELRSTKSVKAKYDQTWREQSFYLLKKSLYCYHTKNLQTPFLNKASSASNCLWLYNPFCASTFYNHISFRQRARHTSLSLLQERGHFSAPETGLLSNTQKWIVWRDTRAAKARGFIGKGTGRRAGGQGTQENSSTTWFTVSGFMVMGLVSGLSLAHHSDSESFLVAQALFSQDGCQWGGFWEVVRLVVSPFDLSRTLPVGGDLLVPCSSPGPPVVKQLMQMVTMVPGQGGQFQPVRLP